MILSVLTFFFVLSSGSVLYPRALLMRRAVKEHNKQEGFSILSAFDVSAKDYRAELEVKTGEANTALNDRSCSAFAEQGVKRSKELVEATQPLALALEAVKARTKALESERKDAASQRSEAASAEKAIAETSLQSNALSHVDAIFKAAVTAEGMPAQDWKDLEDGLTLLAKQTTEVLEVALTEVIKQRDEKQKVVEEIFSQPKEIEFQCSGPTEENVPSLSSSLPEAASQRTSAKLQEASKRMAEALDRKARVIQLEDEIKLEQTLLALLTDLETFFNQKADEVLKDALAQAKEVLDLVFSKELTNQESVVARKKELVEARATLEAVQTQSFDSSTDPAVDLRQAAKQILALRLLDPPTSFENVFEATK